MSLQYETLSFGIHQIHRRVDGYLNATEMCKTAGKKIAQYRLNSETKEYMECLSKQLNLPELTTKTKEYIKATSNELNTPENKLLVIGSGGSPSFIHPLIAIHLANWIDPTFSLFINKIVLDWSQQSKENNSKLHHQMFNLKPSNRFEYELEAKKELIEELVEQGYSVHTEVQTIVGRIDIVTEHEIIEVKKYNNWKHAVGQILMYGNTIEGLGKQKRIHLFTIDEEESIPVSVIVNACTTVGIAVTFSDS